MIYETLIRLLGMSLFCVCGGGEAASVATGFLYTYYIDIYPARSMAHEYEQKDLMLLQFRLDTIQFPITHTASLTERIESTGESLELLHTRSSYLN